MRQNEVPVELSEQDLTKDCCAVNEREMDKAERRRMIKGTGQRPT